MGFGQKLKIDIDQRLHRDGGVQGNRDKLIFFAVIISALVSDTMDHKKKNCRSNSV